MADKKKRSYPLSRDREKELDCINIESALRESEEKYRSLAENLPCIVYRIFLKENNRTQFFNGMLAPLTGYSEDLLCSNKHALTDLIVPEDLKSVIGARKKAVKNNSRFEVDYRFMHMNGESRWFREYGRSIRDSAGKPQFIDGVIMDITERKLAKDKVEESELQYRNFLKNFQGVALKWTLDYGAVFVHGAVKEITGYDAEDFMDNSMSWDDIVHPDDLPGYNGDKKKLQTVRSYTRIREYRIICREGDVKWVDELIQNISGKNGEPEFIHGILHDITERKLTEIALMESEEKFRTLFNQASDGIFLLEIVDNKDVIIVDANISACRDHGYECDELIGRPISMLDTPEMAKFIKERIRTLIDNKKLCFEGDHMRKDGTVFPVEVISQLITISGKNYVLAFDRNITERKIAADALEDEKQRLTITLLSIGDGVIATDSLGRIMLMNPAAENITGWFLYESAGKELSEIFHIRNIDDQGMAENPVKAALQEGKTVGLGPGIILIDKEGKEKIITDTAAPIKDTKNRITGAVLIFRDITEKYKFEKEIQRAQKLESLGILAGGIAHDFNNLLTSIYGNLSMALLQIDSGDRHYESLKDASTASLRARELTSQLLTFARGGAPVKETTSIQDIVKESAEFALRGSNISLKYSYEDGLPPVDIDRGQFNRVVQNLVINARQAMSMGGSIEIALYHTDITAGNRMLLKSGRYIMISIKDTGAGIPQEIIEKIFDPYFTTKQHGSGLGLSTVYSIIKKHDGTVTVESKVKSGSEFRIYLPCSRKKILKVKKGDSGRIEKLPEKKRILVMDDEELVRKTLGLMLNSLGCDVTFADDGSEALGIYMEGRSSGAPFDAVIMDLTIPGGMGGREAIERLVNMDPCVKAIVSSGYSNDPVMAEYRSFGFSGMIKKPYDIEELKKALMGIFGKQKNEI